MDLRTDFRAQIEFGSVRTELFRDRVPDGGTRPDRSAVATPNAVDDLLGGIRIAEFDGLAKGRWILRVQLLGADASVGPRLISVELNGNTAVTAVLTRNCRGVTCPADDPTLLACLGGQCVLPSCLPEFPDACPGPECTEDSACTVTAHCAQAHCVDGSCLTAERQCPTGYWCNPDVGCEPKADMVVPFPEGAALLAVATGPSPAATLSVRMFDAHAATWTEPTPIASNAGTLVTYVVAAIAPDGHEAKIAVQSSDSIKIYSATGSTWTEELSLALVPGGTSRRMDLVYMHSSSRAVFAYAPADDLTPRVREWDGLEWSDEEPVADDPTDRGAPVEWIDLVASPLSDEVTLLYNDTNGQLFSVIWDASAWAPGPAQVLDSYGVRVHEWMNFAAAYESLSGDALAVWGQTRSQMGDGLVYATKPAGATRFGDSVTERYGVNGSTFMSPGPIVLAPEPTSDLIGLAYLEHQENARSIQDFWVATWGGGWIERVPADSDIGSDSAQGIDGYNDTEGATPVAMGWLGNSGHAVAVYPNLPSDGLDFAQWTTLDGWTSPIAAALESPIPAKMSFLVVHLPGQASLLVLVADYQANLWSELVTGETWQSLDDGTPLASPLSQKNGMAFSADAR